MVHMVDCLNQTVINVCYGPYAFEKACLVVEEEMKRLFSASFFLVKETFLQLGGVEKT